MELMIQFLTCKIDTKAKPEIKDLTIEDIVAKFKVEELIIENKFGDHDELNVNIAKCNFDYKGKDMDQQSMVDYICLEILENSNVGTDVIKENQNMITKLWE